MRRAVADEVADQIQSRILEGQLRPGDRLPSERELADELSVNRSSVREALKKLEQLRLVQIHQGSGIRVCRLEEASFDLVRSIVLRDGRLDRRWLGDLLELRTALLPGILRLALERATSKERDEVAALLRRVADPDLASEDFTRSLWELQAEFARMSRNQVLMILANSLGRFMSDPLARALGATFLRDRHSLLPALQRLAIAIEARDLETADRALLDFLRRQNEAFSERLTPDTNPG